MCYARLSNYMKCEYGCNNDANFTTKQGKHICSKSPSQCPINRAKNSLGLKAAYEEGRKDVCNNNLNLESMREKARKSQKEKAKQRFELGQSNHLSNGAIKRIMKDHYNRGDSCEQCGIREWNSKQLSFELDHIDGDNYNNSLDNLRFLCPNCHSQTETFRGRNVNTGKKKVSDEDLIAALKHTSNIRQALISVKMSPRGANYVRASKLLNKMVAAVGFEPTLIRA